MDYVLITRDSHRKFICGNDASLNDAYVGEGNLLCVHVSEKREIMKK